MSDFPKVTIVTPSYNQAQFIEKTIQSVLDQNYPNLEYFIIDGNSNDGSVEIIKKYADKLSWWVSEPDSGQSEAVNKGFKRATGDIIGWLNSDDIFLPGAIQKMVDAFQQHPEVGVVYGDTLAIDTEGTVSNIMGYEQWGIEDLMCFKIIGQPGAFMRRDILEKAGFIESKMHFLMDTHLWLKMVQLAPIHYIPEIIAAARYHPAAKNVGAGARYGKDAYLIVEWMETQPLLAEKLAADSKLRKRVWAGAHRMSARYLLDGGSPGAALRDYLRCLKAHPPTALSEWHRMVYAALALIGLERLKPLYLRLRRSRNSNQNPSVYNLEL